MPGNFPGHPGFTRAQLRGGCGQIRLFIAVFVEDECRPELRHGGGGKEEKRDEDADFDDEAYDDPYGEVEEAYQQHQLIRGFQPEARAAEQDQAREERQERDEEFGYVEGWIEAEVIEQLDFGRGGRVLGIGIGHVLQVKLHARAGGACEQAEDRDRGARARQRNRQRHAEEESGSEDDGHVGAHQRLAQTEGDDEETEERERDSIATRDQNYHRGEIEGRGKSLGPLPGKDPEDGELGDRQEKREEGGTMRIAGDFDAGGGTEEAVEEPETSRIRKSLDQRDGLPEFHVGVLLQKANQERYADAVLHWSGEAALVKIMDHLLEGRFPGAQLIVLDEKEGRAGKQDDDCHQETFPEQSCGFVVPGGFGRGLRSLSLNYGAHGLSLSV